MEASSNIRMMTFHIPEDPKILEALGTITLLGSRTRQQAYPDYQAQRMCPSGRPALDCADPQSTPQPKQLAEGLLVPTEHPCSRYSQAQCKTPAPKSMVAYPRVLCHFHMIGDRECGHMPRLRPDDVSALLPSDFPTKFLIPPTLLPLCAGSGIR